MKVMVAESKEEKQLFLKCKKSVQEIVGWKVFIFLPQSFGWRFFIITTVLVTVVLNVAKFFYQIDVSFVDFVDLICDSIYTVDVLLASMHYAMKKTRALKSGKKRHIIFLLIDYISLIPFKFANRKLMFCESEKELYLSPYFHLNALLRVYQIPMCFSDAKKSTYKVQTYFAMIILELLTYGVLITHVFSCFLVLHFDDVHKERCQKQLLTCIIENELVTLTLLRQSYLTPFTKFPLDKYKVLLIFDLFFGYLFTYGYIIPLVLFVIMKTLAKYFDYSKKWLQFNMSVKNLTADKELKQRILSYFHYAWTYGKGNRHPEILKVFPLSLKKSIFCDMHWDAIRHSELFQDLSLGCKRSLALHMTTEFVLPDTTLYYISGMYSDFLYLESGVLQIMATENNNSPTLNLSSGTVLREISLFFHTECKATVNVAEFSIIHLLNYKDFFRVLSDYPKDLKKVFKKVQMRLKVAKSTNMCKKEVNPLFSNYRNSNEGITQMKEGNIKWIKQQYTALTQLYEAEKLKKINLNKENISRYQLKTKNLETELQHTSLYLPLLCINKEVLNKFDTVCIKMTFPWMMDPNCHFLFVWKIIMSILMVFTVALYPAVLGWFLILPTWFVKVSVLITLMYIIDVLVRLFTAVKFKYVVISKFSFVVLHNLSCPSFYVDILAAIPFQLLIYFYRNKLQERPMLNLFLVNTLVKSYKLIPILNKWNHEPKPEAFIRTLFKYFILLIVFTYWTAAVFNLSGVECIFYECGHQDWYSKIPKEDNFDPIIASFTRAVFLALDTPEEISKTDIYPSFLVSMFFLMLFYFFYIALLAESIASYVTEFTYELEYKRLMTIIYDYMGHRKMKGQIRNRVMETMQFLWYYDKGQFITQSYTMLDDISVDLRQEVNRKWLLPILANTELFALEDEKFLKELCKKAEFLVLPAKSLLQIFGTQPTRLYVIYKGFIQMNSFIAGDVRMNFSTPILLKEKDTFPVLDAFSQRPAAVTAIAITDCQLVSLDLEDVLSTISIHGSFKDLIDALRKTNLSALSTAKLCLSPISNVIIYDKKFNDSVFLKFHWLGTLLKFLLKNRTVESHSAWYIRWEFSRVFCILIGLISWPLVFGVCDKLECQPTLIQVLCGFDCISFIDFYIRLHIAYYNKIGIKITHPLTTSLHYLSTAFIADLIAFIPNFHMLYFIVKNEYKFHLSEVVSHILLRSVALYRILGLLRFLKDSMKVNYPGELFKCLFFIILGVHYYANVMVFCFFEKLKKTHETSEIKDEKNPFICYLHELVMAFSMMMKNSFKFNDFNYHVLWATSLLVISGIVSHIHIYSFLTLTSTTSNKNLTTYQYYMKSFVQYLNTQKAEDKISALAIQHFEHQWQKQKGYDAHEIFSKFPQTLHEDIIYPLYKKSLKGVKCLSKANCSFHRTLCRDIREIYLQKGSVIIYKKKVEDNIFFIHKGDCFIENSPVVLSEGSMLGDISGKGIMKNTITAKSNVQLLKIKSKTFFLALSNFYTTKKEYESAVANADDFLLSKKDEEKENVSEIFLTEKNGLENEFIIVIDENEKEERKNLYSEKKIKKTIINPKSRTLRFLNICFLIDACCTVIFVPIFVAFRLVSPYMLTAIYILDVIWVVKILVTIRTAFFDKKTGELVSIKKAIVIRYLRRVDGLIFHIFTILPIELIAYACFGIPVPDQYCSATSMCYINRLGRAHFIYSYIQKGSKKLLTNFYKGLVGILLIKIALINFCVCCHISIRREHNTELLICYREMHYSIIDSLTSSYLFVLNVFVGGGLFLDIPTNLLESVFRLFISVWALLTKAFFLNQVLLIIYVTHETKSDEMLKLEQLEKYLSVRDVSPALFQRTQKYFCDLLDSFNEGAEPSFLNEAPSYIKRTIMHDLYTHHLSNCYVFQGVEEVFLTQLVERLQRFIFFPGDYITEIHDVDHSMYFIQKGEVNCIEPDKNIRGLELTVDTFVAGDNFGVLQGVFLAYPHSNSYRAKTLSDILVLNYYMWEDLRAAFPEITKFIYKRCMQYDTKSKKAKNSEEDK